MVFTVTDECCCVQRDRGRRLAGRWGRVNGPGGAGCHLARGQRVCGNQEGRCGGCRRSGCWGRGRLHGLAQVAIGEQPDGERQDKHAEQQRRPPAATAPSHMAFPRVRRCASRSSRPPVSTPGVTPASRDAKLGLSERDTRRSVNRHVKIYVATRPGEHRKPA